MIFSCIKYASTKNLAQFASSYEKAFILKEKQPYVIFFEWRTWWFRCLHSDVATNRDVSGRLGNVISRKWNCLNAEVRERKQINT